MENCAHLYYTDVYNTDLFKMSELISTGGTQESTKVMKVPSCFHGQGESKETKN